MSYKTISQFQIGQRTAKNSQIVTTAVKLINSGASTGPSISSIVVTDSGYNNLDDTAAATSNSYIRILGSNFTSTANVFLNGTMVPTANVTFVSSSELRAALPVSNTGNYAISVYNSNSAGALYSSSFVISTMPQWLTSTTLANVTSNIAFSNTLSATSDSAVTYANTTALPPGTTLASNGYFSGTITVGSQTTYSFDVKATDAENQDTTRTFSLTATTVQSDPYWNNVILLLNGNGISSGTTFTDSSPSGWVNSSINNPYTVTSTKKYGTASIFLTGSNKVALGIASSGYNLNGAFTIEMWLYVNNFSGGSGATIHILESVNGGLDLQYAWNRYGDSNANGNLPNYSFRLGGSNDTWGSNSSQAILDTGQWYHYAATATSGSSNISHWLNGVSIGSSSRLTATYAINGSSQSFRLNGENTGSSQYYIDDLRITRGVARYTTTFTPPTSELGQYI